MITKQTCQNFRVDFRDAVKDLEKKYGVAVTIGKINFTSSSISTKLEAVETDNTEGDPRVAVWADKFKKEYMLYGIDAADLNKEFNLGAKRVRLVGLDPKKRKYPLICEDVDKPNTFIITTPETFNRAAKSAI